MIPWKGDTPYHIRVIRRGRPAIETIKVIEKNLDTIPVKLSYVKDRILKNLRAYINANRERPIEEHNIDSDRIQRLTKRENLFNVIKEGSRILRLSKYRWTLSIGEKRLLDKHAKYWRIINYGGKIQMKTKMGGVPGYFGRGKPPIEGGSGSVFHYSPGFAGTKTFGSFYMIPMKPIPPMYYLNYLAKRFKEEIEKIYESMKKR